MSQQDWVKRFLALAEHISTWSKDPSTKVGAVIADANNRIVSVGFNGFPRGVADDTRLDDRSKKYEMVVHAEINAILFAGRQGTSLYTFPFLPCSRCAAMIIQAGIREVVSLHTDNPRWTQSIELSKQMFAEADVHVFEH